MSTIYNYWCPDPADACKLPGRRQYQIEKEEDWKEVEKQEELCPSCGTILKLQGMANRFKFSRISLMDRDKKTEMFKKRSHQDYKKNIEESKRETIKKFNKEARSKGFI